MTENENRESSQSPIEDLQRNRVLKGTCQLEATLRNEHDDLCGLRRRHALITASWRGSLTRLRVVGEPLLRL